MIIYICQNHGKYNPKMNYNVNYGLWIIMMCQCRFISFNQHTTLVKDVNNGDAVVMGVGAYGKSLPSIQHYCELKTALKSKSILYNNNNKKEFIRNICITN